MANGDDLNSQFLTENSVDILCRVGIDLVMHYASPSCFPILGWSSKELEGLSAAERIFADDLPLVMANIARLKLKEITNSTATVRMLKKDGSFVWMENNVRLIRDPVTGEPTEYVLVMRDVGDRKLLEDKLSAMAMSDGLTGLANRRAFDEALEREWRRTLREGSEISLLLLDVDYFKAFNDRYGHQVGDDCLRAVAVAISAAVNRVTDIVARYGGEEIAIILPSTNTAGAIKVAQCIRSGIQALEISHEGNIEGAGWVTASIGVATALSRHGGTMAMPQGLLQAADNALYKAKNKGRNRVATTLLIAPKASV
jgi:diguanylate cyclase (GGDEF)-like protein/PAS domain S-box-containing protein